MAKAIMSVIHRDKVKTTTVDKPAMDNVLLVDNLTTMAGCTSHGTRLFESGEYG